MSIVPQQIKKPVLPKKYGLVKCKAASRPPTLNGQV